MVERPLPTFGALLAAAEQQPLWLRIGPTGRLRVLAALLVIVTLGLLLVLFIRSFGKFMRSYGDRDLAMRQANNVDADDDWARSPLPDAEEDGS